MTKATGKPATSFRLTAEAKRLLTALSKKHGVSKTAVVELALRAFAGES